MLLSARCLWVRSFSLLSWVAGGAHCHHPFADKTSIIPCDYVLLLCKDPIFISLPGHDSDCSSESRANTGYSHSHISTLSWNSISVKVTLSLRWESMRYWFLVGDGMKALSVFLKSASTLKFGNGSRIWFFGSISKAFVIMILWQGCPLFNSAKLWFLEP
jgi:hypothetical protein